MLKLTLVLAAWACVALGDKDVPIVAQEMSVDPDGHFHWSYEGGDGSKAVQDGELRAFDKDVTGEVFKGAFEYKGDDGQTYSLTYTADENGYHPEGAHLPVAPPVPEAILKALEYIRTHPPKEEYNKKF